MERVIKVEGNTIHNQETENPCIGPGKKMHELWQDNLATRG